jgi:hypothetical protein
MQITRNSAETAAGPSEWFTGAVYIDAITTPSGHSRLLASSVHFTPGARTAWHTHPKGLSRGRLLRRVPRRPLPGHESRHRGAQRGRRSRSGQARPLRPAPP